MPRVTGYQLPRQPRAPSAYEAALIASTVGADVRGYRTRRALSMTALARLTGVSANTISAVERGTGRPSFDALQRLAVGIHRGDHDAIEEQIHTWCRQLGASVVQPPGVPLAVARESMTAVLGLALAKLGLDVDEPRVRLAVMAAIEELDGRADQVPALTTTTPAALEAAGPEGATHG